MKTKRYSLQTMVFETRGEMGRAAAEEVVQAIVALMEKQDTVRMIFAAAPSQDEFLKAFVEDSRVDFSRIVAFHMDEYVGLAADAPQGFGNFLRNRLFGQAPFKAVHYINGNAQDMQAECDRYTALLADAPIDIVCMGIGENGHIAFNDPHVARIDDPAAVKLVELDDVCRMQQVHDGCFGSLAQVPKQALTLTCPAFIHAPRLYCIVPAASKARAVERTLHGPVSEDCPATILRQHPAAALYLDAESAGLL